MFSQSLAILENNPSGLYNLKDDNNHIPTYYPIKKLNNITFIKLSTDYNIGLALDSNKRLHIFNNVMSVPFELTHELNEKYVDIMCQYYGKFHEKSYGDSNDVYGIHTVSENNDNHHVYKLYKLSIDSLTKKVNLNLERTNIYKNNIKNMFKNFEHTAILVDVNNKAYTRTNLNSLKPDQMIVLAPIQFELFNRLMMEKPLCSNDFDIINNDQCWGISDFGNISKVFNLISPTDGILGAIIRGKIHIYDTNYQDFLIVNHESFSCYIDNQQTNCDDVYFVDAIFYKISSMILAVTNRQEIYLLQLDRRIMIKLKTNSQEDAHLKNLQKFTKSARQINF